MPRGWAGSKVDVNQPAIVKALERHGASVQSLAAIGKGCPDLLVGWRATFVTMEIKDPGKVLSKRQLSPREKEWQAKWAGFPNFVVETEAQALDILRAIDLEVLARLRRAV